MGCKTECRERPCGRGVQGPRHSGSPLPMRLCWPPLPVLSPVCSLQPSPLPVPLPLPPLCLSPFSSSVSLCLWLHICVTRDRSVALPPSLTLRSCLLASTSASVSDPSRARYLLRHVLLSVGGYARTHRHLCVHMQFFCLRGLWLSLWAGDGWMA
jgi:hypothetical protein